LFIKKKFSVLLQWGDTKNKCSGTRSDRDFLVGISLWDYFGDRLRLLKNQ
jgi:hypothetical protein